jgi:hypothetical protein
MESQRSKVDVINMVLEDCIVAYPVSSFIISLYQQYQQRGWLTKKQLEGLHAKATTAKIGDERLAALEAIIKKMPNRQKSELPEVKPMYEKDEEVGKMIENVLSKYPQHKRVLYLQLKYNNNEPLSSTEINELKTFVKRLNN